MTLPALIPVTTPVKEPIVARDRLLDVQTPPAVVSAKVVLSKAQTDEEPVIAVGEELPTLRLAVTEQVPKVYVITVVPVVVPELNIPVELPIVPMVVGELLHVPLLTLLVNEL